MRSWLYELVQEYAEAAKNRVDALKKEQAQLDARKLEINAELAKLRGAEDRRYKFREKIDERWQCPWCWETDGVEHELTALPSPSHDDLFRCRRCGHEFTYSP